jgi:hypothetical protein
MWKHIDDNNLMSDKQYGFRKKFNTTTQLLHVTYKAAEALNNKKNHHIVSFDFSKAFDKVPHQLLLHKLRGYSFNTQVLKWIEHWLEGRTSQVIVNGSCSGMFKNRSGVPQGSVLGPLLFLLYVNDMPRDVSSDCRLYADDALLCCNVRKSDGSDLQKDVSLLEKWSKTWCMPFNNKKCQHMQVGKETPDFTLFLNGEPISTTRQMKYLGVTIDCHIKWNTHVSNVVKQATKRLGMIKRCLDGANTKTKVIAFNTVVRPILEYATQVWSPSEVGLIRDIDRVHRRAIRWAYRMRKQDSVVEVRMLESITDLKERRDQQDVLFLRRMEFGDYGVYLESYINRNLTHDTRKGVLGNCKRINAFKNHFYNRMESQVKVLLASRYR